MNQTLKTRQASCPACSHGVAVTFLDSEPQPLATLAWPTGSQQARELDKFVLDFVRCVDCGHVFNVAFEYQNVPYSEKPNLMFNKGFFWSDFIIRARDSILDHLPDEPVVVEIGHGDSSFLSALFEAKPKGKFIGFDPNGATETPCGVTLRTEMFDPDVHLAELMPDMVISRHVLEHLLTPLGFLQSLSFSAASLNIAPIAYFEVPCIDKAITSGRTVDFYYEHSSQFTTESFTRMLQASGAGILDIGHGYDGEVIFGFVRLGETAVSPVKAKETIKFHQDANEALSTIKAHLDDMISKKFSIAIWGGTGKSAAFMCRYELDKERFPLVVDSDPEKVGTFVPGTGQEIRSRDVLKRQPVDALIIPPQWRAKDIRSEMEQAGISINTILIEHDGKLINFEKDSHFYR